MSIIGSMTEELLTVIINKLEELDTERKINLMLENE